MVPRSMNQGSSRWPESFWAAHLILIPARSDWNIRAIRPSVSAFPSPSPPAVERDEAALRLLALLRPKIPLDDPTAVTIVTS